MSEEDKKVNDISTSGPTKTKQFGQGGFRNGGGKNRFPKKEGHDNKRANFERPKPEFDQKMVSIRRVTRVVAGGRRMSFAVALAIGDKKGSVGLGTGKGGDTAVAINKALRQAKKNMFKVKTDKNMSIVHEAKAKFSSSKLTIFPNHGKGLVAGSTVRDILSLAGLKNVTAKLNSGSKNKLNNAKVVFLALSKLGASKKMIKIENIVPEEMIQKEDSLQETI